MRRSQMIINKKKNPEMKKSTMMSSNLNFSKGPNMRESLKSRRSMFSGKKKYETSGSSFVNQMSQRVDKLLGRSIHKKTFKKRFETSAY